MAAPSPQDSASAIQAASAKYNVPTKILVGVMGAESSFGTAYQNGGTTYGYFGLTSPGLWSPSDTLGQDADISAQTLATLYKQHGDDWDAALQAYSGGGYGLAHVDAMVQQAPAALKAILSGSTAGAPTPGGNPGSSASSGSSGGSGSLGGLLGGATLDALNAITIDGVPITYVLIGGAGVVVLAVAMWAGGVTI